MIRLAPPAERSTAIGLSRRSLLAGLAAALAPVEVRAVQRAPRIGVLMLGEPSPDLFLQQLREGLRELGYVEGQGIHLELRDAGGSPEKLKADARELVELRVDVIVAFQTPAVLAAKEATTSLPIIMCPAADPVATGLVASLARPDGNLTGVTTATAELAGKTLDLMKEALPQVRRVGVLVNALDPFHAPFAETVVAAARALALEPTLVPVGGGQDLQRAFGEVVVGGVQAVMVQPSLPRERSTQAALEARLPLAVPNAEFGRAGALIAYGVDIGAVYRQSASFVDKIVKGRRPADLPVEFATKFLLVVNLKTAQALDVTLPPSLIARADEIVE